MIKKNLLIFLAIWAVMAIIVNAIPYRRVVAHCPEKTPEYYERCTEEDGGIRKGLGGGCYCGMIAGWAQGYPETITEEFVIQEGEAVSNGFSNSVFAVFPSLIVLAGLITFQYLRKRRAKS